MATCEKCGNHYYQKNCPHCKKIAWKKNINKNNQHIFNKKNKTYQKIQSEKKLSEKQKLYKTIRYAIIFFIGILTIGTLIEIYIIKKTTDITEPMIKETFKSLEVMHKMNEKALKEISKGFINPYEQKK